MKSTFKFVAGVVAVLAAMQAQAITVSLSSAPGTGNITFSSGLPAGFSGGHVYNASVSGTATQPSVATGAYWAIGLNEVGKIDFTTLLGGDALQVGFLWGSPDSDNGKVNTVTFKSGNTVVASFNSAQVFSGVFSPSQPAGTNLANRYVTFGISSNDHVTSAEFTTTKVAFEVDNFSVTAVPEPESYALMLAGLGVMGFVARRRAAK